MFVSNSIDSVVLAIAPKVGAIGLLLVASGLALVGLTLRFWSSARPEPVSLAPLEIMSDRRFRMATESERSAMVDSVRDLVAAAPHGVVRRMAGSTPRNSGTTSPSGNPAAEQPARRAPIDPLIK